MSADTSELLKALEQEREARKRLERALSDASGRATDWQRRCCDETARAERAEARLREVEGHVDHLAAVSSDRDEWKARAEQAEGQQRSDVAKMQAWRSACETAQAEEQRAIAERRDAHVARERAERERDALKHEHDEDQGVIRVWRGRCERAEAANAALLGRIRSTRRLIEAGQPLAALADIVEDERHGIAHPGAALLEYVRALEAWREEVRKTVDGWAHAEDCPAAPEDEDVGPCECANGEMQALLAKADALKVAE